MATGASDAPAGVHVEKQMEAECPSRMCVDKVVCSFLVVLS